MDGFSADPAAIEAVADVVASLVPALADVARTVGAGLSPDAGASTSELGDGLHHLGGQAAGVVVHLETLASALRSAAAGYAATDTATSLTFPGGAAAGGRRP
jgi:hypothetical protein